MTAPEPAATPDADLAALEAGGDYEALLAALRERVAAGRAAAFRDPWLNAWAGRRFQSLFLDACLAMPAAREHVTKAGEAPDEAELRRRLAARFIYQPDAGAVAGEQPPAAAARVARTTLVFCPGLLNGLLPVAGFGAAFPEIQASTGMRVLAADAHPLRGCQANVADLLDTIERGLGFDAEGAPISPEAAVPPGDIVLLGYSKGLPDALHLLRSRPDLGGRVRAVLSWAGGSGGSHLADFALENVKDRHLKAEQQEALIRQAAKPMMPGVVLQNLERRRHEYDVRAALYELGTSFRASFWERNRETFEAFDFPWFYVVALARLIDLPYFHLPLSFGVALRDRFNDMQLTRSQASLPLPGAVHLASFHADHWDIAYPSFPPDMRMGSKKLEHHFPREAGLAALVRLLAELGVID